MNISDSERSSSPGVSPPGIVNILPDLIEQPQQPFDDDDHSGEIREYNGVFEGPEKTLGKSISVSCNLLGTCTVVLNFNFLVTLYLFTFPPTLNRGRLSQNSRI